LSLLGYKEKNSLRFNLKVITSSGYEFALFAEIGSGGGEGRGQYGEAPPERSAFFKLAVCLRVGKQGHKIGCKVEEMAAKATYIKGCQILATRNT